METVAFCEYDEKARKVLNKHWPDVPMYNDVRTLTGEQLEKDGITDIGLICGGYPCQPFSVAGKREGQADDRHLWPEFFRLIQEIRPTWVIAENVAGHINMGLDSVLADLESEGYQQQVFLIPACAVGAYHRRDRVWILAHSDSGSSASAQQKREYEGAENDSRSSHDELDAGTIMANAASNGGKRIAGEFPKENELETSRRQEERVRQFVDAGNGQRNDVADTLHQGLQRGQGTGNPESSRKEREEFLTGRGERSESGNWLPEPPVGRVANGVSGRVDRLKQLGNAVVPQIPEVLGRAILEADRGT
jgi:DNA (cytosine-5)-methyltransferase 1